MVDALTKALKLGGTAPKSSTKIKGRSGGRHNLAVRKLTLYSLELARYCQFFQGSNPQEYTAIPHPSRGNVETS